MEQYQIRKQAARIKKFIGSATLDSMTYYANSLGYSVVYDTENLSPTAEFVDLNEHIICITNKMDEPTARHLLAHALGHVVLKHKRIFADETPQENEANYFAKCLLKTTRRKKLALSVALLAAIVLGGGWLFADSQNQTAEPPPTAQYSSAADENISKNISGVLITKTDDNSEEVLVTKSGRKYHKPNCQYVEYKTNTISLSLDEAIRAGYEPCKVCFR